MDEWQIEMLKNNKKIMEEIKENNERLLKVPTSLSEEEAETYKEILKTIKDNIKYRISETDMELIWQYCQIKIMRDRAWREYNKNPERYIRIVTGICSDGRTPKVMIKENEHYKTLIDCNKHLEKLLKDLRLTPETRNKK